MAEHSIKHSLFRRFGKSPVTIICKLFPLLLVVCSCHNKEVEKSTGRIIIEFQLSQYKKYDDLILTNGAQLEYVPIGFTEDASQWKNVKGRIVDGNIKWLLHSVEPLQSRYNLGWLPIISPGDSIHIVYNGKKFIFSGRGSDKLNAWTQIRETEHKFIKPAKYSFAVKSFEDYILWCNYVDKRLAVQIPIIDAYKNKINPFEYNHLKAGIVSSAEEQRIYAFGALQNNSFKDTSSILTSTDLVAIWDSTQYKPWSNWLRSLTNYYGSVSAIYKFNAMEVQRKFEFDIKNDSLVSKELSAFLSYNLAKQKYKGLFRERLLVFILTKINIKKADVNKPMIQALLKDYYSQSEFVEYKQLVHEFEDNAKKLAIN